MNTHKVIFRGDRKPINITQEMADGIFDDIRNKDEMICFMISGKPHMIRRTEILEIVPMSSRDENHTGGVTYVKETIYKLMKIGDVEKMIWKFQRVNSKSGDETITGEYFGYFDNGKRVKV